MSRTEQIIQEINLLTPSELELVYYEIQKRVNKTNRVKEVLSKIRGKGKGVWLLDAQEYVNQLREDDRF
jgi:hypothetical protein